jgi:hypothetical protein
MRAILRALLIVLVPALCAAQTALPDPAATQMVRAAGMPLNDGALAPGMLTIRVVEGAFTRDIANQVVEVEVAGGKIESARTGPDGRAQFAHLPVGARVRASAAVGGERLESDSFEMPAQSGVRVLLVAGSGAGAPLSADSAPAAGSGTWPGGSSTTLPPNHPPIADASVALPVAPSQARGEDDGVLAVRAVLVTSTVFAFGIVWFRRPRRK